MCAVSSPPVHKIIILFSFDGAHRARAAGRGLRLYCATHTPTRHTPIVIRWLCWKKNLLLEFHYGFIFNVKNFHFFSLSYSFSCWFHRSRCWISASSHTSVTSISRCTRSDEESIYISTYKVKKPQPPAYVIVEAANINRPHGTNGGREKEPGAG